MIQETLGDKEFKRVILEEIESYRIGTLEYISDWKKLALKFSPPLTPKQMSSRASRLRKLDSKLSSKWRAIPKHACSRYTPDQLIEHIRQEMKDLRTRKRETVSTLKELGVGKNTLYGFNDRMPPVERKEYNLLIHRQTRAKLRNTK